MSLNNLIVPLIYHIFIINLTELKYGKHVINIKNYEVIELKKILIAGGLCGTTMLMASERIVEECCKNKIEATVKIHNLWESTYIGGNYDIIIEMFPFFKDLPCPILSGKPFICKREEDKLIKSIITILKGE